jgi:hypothetical protein
MGYLADNRRPLKTSTLSCLETDQELRVISLDEHVQKVKDAFCDGKNSISILACPVCCSRKRPRDLIMTHIVKSTSDGRQNMWSVWRWLLRKLDMLTGKNELHRTDIIACECGKMIENTTHFKKKSTQNIQCEVVSNLRVGISPPARRLGATTQKEYEQLLGFFKGDERRLVDWMFEENRIWIRTNFWHANNCKCCSEDCCSEDNKLQRPIQLHIVRIKLYSNK